MSWGMNPFGIPFMQNAAVVQSPQPVQAVTLNQPQPAPTQSINAGRWEIVKSYQDATRVTASIDGAPTICMLENDSVFYVVRIVDGRKEIGIFRYTPVTENVGQQATNNQQLQTVQQVQDNGFEDRLARMEKSMSELTNYMSYIRSALGEGVSNNDSVSSVPKG